MRMLRNLKHFYRPDTLQEALKRIRQPGTVPLGGGTHLMASGTLDVDGVVDLGHLELSYVEAELERLRIGATTTLQQLSDSPEMDALTQGLIGPVVRLVAARNLREQATVGGMLATGEADHPLLVLLLSLDASLMLWTPEERAVALDSFLSYHRQVLGEGSLITELFLPRRFGRVGVGFDHVGRTPRDRPIVCAAASVLLKEGVCEAAQLAMGGVAERPVRAPKAEQLLRGQPLTPEVLEQAAAVAVERLSPAGDFRGSGEYRREMAGTLARRALAQAVERADRPR